MMATISAMIQQLIDIAREQGIEPNRVRMGHEAYRQLRNDVAQAEGREQIAKGNDILADVGKIHGLTIVLPLDCPPDYILVDYWDKAIEEQRKGLYDSFWQGIDNGA